MTSFAFARLRATKQSAAQICWAGILLFKINLYLAIVKVALPLWLMSNIVVSYPIMNQSSKITCNVMYTDASSLITQMFKIVLIAAQHLGLWYFFDGDKKMMMLIHYFQVLDLGGNNLQILPREVFSRHGLLNLQKLKVGLFVLRFFFADMNSKETINDYSCKPFVQIPTESRLVFDTLLLLQFLYLPVLFSCLVLSALVLVKRRRVLFPIIRLITFCLTHLSHLANRSKS